MQFIPLTLKALKPKETDFTPISLGGHLKKRRLELKLTQKDTGKRLGVTSFTITNWEHGLRKPAIQHFPAIGQFLGYDPEPPTPGTLAERLAAKRREFGWTQRVAAQKLGVDPSTWSAWEQGGTIMSKEYRHLVATFIGLPEATLDSTMRKQWNDLHGKQTPE